MSLAENPLTQHVNLPLAVNEHTQALKKTLLKNIKRSAYVYRVDCGGCNGC